MRGESRFGKALFFGNEFLPFFLRDLLFAGSFLFGTFEFFRGRIVDLSGKIWCRHLGRII
jgi:hypothetical protein